MWERVVEVGEGCGGGKEVWRWEGDVEVGDGKCEGGVKVGGTAEGTVGIRISMSL